MKQMLAVCYEQGKKVAEQDITSMSNSKLMYFLETQKVQNRDVVFKLREETGEAPHVG